MTSRTREGWFEEISENFMVPGGNPRRVLEAVCRDYPVVLHGVSLSIGSVDPLDWHYLDQLATLARDIQPAWISDHLCWGSAHGMYAHDLLPIPYTSEALAHVAARVSAVQDHLGRRILLENTSSYLALKGAEKTEWEFLAELARRADCGILLDVNNIFVSAHNQGFDPHDYLDGIPGERVGQIHLAGHTAQDGLLIDTHDGKVRAEVWALYAEAMARFGMRSTMIEWDAREPPCRVSRWPRAMARARAARYRRRKRRCGP